MEQTDSKICKLLHPPIGPLAPYVDEFAKQIIDQGFKHYSMCPQVRLMAKFSSWLEANDIDLQNVTDEHAQQFLNKLSRGKSVKKGYFATIHRIMAFLHQLNAIPEQIPLAVEMTPGQLAVYTFGQHLKLDQGLLPGTCIQYLSFVEQFLVERFENEAINFNELSAADVVGFIRRQAVRLSPSRAKSATIALRSYMRYLRFRGEIKLDLASAVPTVPNWSMTGIPRAISPDHVRAVLESCCRDTAVGCRDYAILLLLARLGLRSSEIVALTLDSIDWDIGCITVVGKGGNSSKLPLPAEVGAAIAVYLQQGHPRNSCRALFLRTNAPIRGLGSFTSIGSIVLAAITRAKIETRYKGAHQFRHALACEMLRQGASMTEIGSLLRHRHPKTTGIYAKVDFVALRPLSQPWPGVTS